MSPAHSSRLPRVRMLLVATVAMLVSLAVMAGAARADDLLVLNGDTETLSGDQSFGLVYIDGGLQLTGDTTISAASIYIGPDASIDSCFVVGSGDTCPAGRSLTLDSSGPLTVATGIDLSGGTNVLDPGGNLTLSGGPVAITNPIDTSGQGGSASGQVSISSTSTLAVDGIYAPGAPVNLKAAGAIDVGDDIQTEGTSASPTSVQSAGPVTINSSGGDVRVDGGIDAYGRGAPTLGGLNGGNGAPVTITGTNVQTHDISTTGGGSNAAFPGDSAPVAITARGTLNAFGTLDASGQDGANGTGAGGSQITLKAAGPLAVGDDVEAGGGQSAGGGAITIAGSTVTGGDLNAAGGDGSGANPTGGPGGSINVTAPNGALLGSLLVYGGNSQGGAAAGSGGTINVSSSAGSIDLSSAQSQGGSQNSGPGANGGPITLAADGNLSIGNTLNSSGSDANGSNDPPWSGGNAGNVTLRADTGTLTLGGNGTAEGGAGSNPHTNGAIGGTGGAGGQIEIVASAIGELASLSSAGGPGGNYGDTQGPGGPGGAILAWTDAQLFNDEQLVSSDGGDGNPTGVAGNQQQDSSPSALTIDSATGLLSFTSQSPNAQRYRVLMSVGGAAPVTALTTSATSKLHLKAPLCEAVSLTVVAVNSTVPWTSDPSSALNYVRRPSASQSCSDAPVVTGTGDVHRSLRQLRRAHWLAALSLKTNGVGVLKATLRGGGKLSTVSLKIKRPGTYVLHLPIPPGARSLGNHGVRLTSTSPDGKRHLTTTLRLEVVA